MYRFNLKMFKKNKLYFIEKVLQKTLIQPRFAFTATYNIMLYGDNDALVFQNFTFTYSKWVLIFDSLDNILCEKPYEFVKLKY